MPGSFTYLQMTDADQFPFWILVVNGKRTRVPLPDLEAAWGIPALELWRGDGFLQAWRVYQPGVTIDRWDWTNLDQTQWRAWSQNQFYTVW